MLRLGLKVWQRKKKQDPETICQLLMKLPGNDPHIILFQFSFALATGSFVWPWSLVPKTFYSVRKIDFAAT